MAFVDINPGYREFLERHGLVGVDDFLALSGVVICGHPDRHVAQVTLGSGPSAVEAFLKREHRVRWRDRWANAWAGFGYVSKSYREAVLLRAVRQAGIGCPEVIACGEDRHGRTFLLIRGLAGARDLRLVLRDRLAVPSRERCRLARRLGEALARMHDAGFDHPDLYAKHILVDPYKAGVSILDWQRSRRRHLDRQRRWHDLAALDATLADDLATPRERLACLRAYLRATLSIRLPRSLLARAAGRIRRHAHRLLHKRHVREQRQPPLEPGSQNLIWLDGEALCVTREFWAGLNGHVPPWLAPADPSTGPSRYVTRAEVLVAHERPATLVRRRSRRPLNGFWTWLRRRPSTSPELQQAGLLFRLQRYGINTPRLLAVGQRHSARGQIDSFLLTEPAPGTVALAPWLAEHPLSRQWTPARRRYWQLIRTLAHVLCRLHEAHCYLGSGPVDACGEPFLVQAGSGQTPPLIAATAEGLHTRRRRSPARERRDLGAVRRLLDTAGSSRTDALRFLLAYLGLKRLTPAAKRLARSVRLPRPQPFFSWVRLLRSAAAGRWMVMEGGSVP